MSAPVSTSATPGIALGLADIGHAKARMRMRRAQHHGMEHAGGRMIGDIAAAAAQERVVLLPPHGWPKPNLVGVIRFVLFRRRGAALAGASRRRLVFSAIQRQTT